MKIVNKLLYCLILVIVLFNFFGVKICNAVELQNANIFFVGSADYHLKYFREDTNTYRYVICSIVGYNNDNGIFYPAYCVNKDLQGVTDEISYNVKVNDVISRDDVWRVVKNGYPYKSPEEMGLDNSFDAFAVTKFAVYCIIGQSDLSKFYAEPDDVEANCMLNALYNLVDIGVNGTETRTSGNFSISKIGDFEEEGKYYFQKYKIHSDIEMKDINIEICGNLPNGSYASKIDNSNFKVFIPKEVAEGNINGKIKISGVCKTYPIFYGDSENAETQDYILTYDTFENVSSVCDVNIKFDMGQIKILKVDEENNEVKLKNVKFNVLDEKGNVLETLITDENGEAISSKYLIKKYGKLVIQEVETGEEYQLKEEPVEIELKENQITDIQFENGKIKNQVKIIKSEKGDINKKLEGVKFELLDEESNVLEILTTDKNGEAISQYYPVVNKVYTLHEIETLEGYEILDEYICFELNKNEIVEFNFENEKVPDKIEIPNEEIEVEEEMEVQEEPTKVEEVKKEEVIKKEEIKKEIIKEVVEVPVVKEEIKVLPRTGY